MIDVTGNEVAADQALAILIQHLVKAGYGEHNKGRLRDFLVRGIRSAARAQSTQTLEKQISEKPVPEPASPATPPPPLNLDAAQLDAEAWVGYWRDGLLQRAWRALERHQHSQRQTRDTKLDAKSDDATKPAAGDAVVSGATDGSEDLVHDVLRAAMAHPAEKAALLSARVAVMAGRSVNESEVRSQLATGRLRLAQFLADEVAQTLADSDAGLVRDEIKTLGLQKAFAGVAIRP